MQSTGILYIIAAPSGAGKTSLIKRLIETIYGVEVSVSHTTRPVRPGEQDGKDYYFVDQNTFQALIEEGIFLEYARVFDYWYGTSRHAVFERLQAGIDVILEIDWQGARQVCERVSGTCTIFILPPSREALRQRLRSRAQDSEEIIERRMAAAISEISHYREFDYIIINDNFDMALKTLHAIFIANRHRGAVQIVRQRELLQALLS
jgi:guanylate kinase